MQICNHEYFEIEDLLQVNTCVKMKKRSASADGKSMVNEIDSFEKSSIFCETGEAVF